MVLSSSEYLFLQSLMNGIILGLIYSMAAIGLSVAFGVMGLINVAHGDFLILGSFLTYTFVTYFGLDPLLSIPIVSIIGALLGFTLQKYIVNRIVSGPHLVTLVFFFGLFIALPNLYIIVWGPYTRSINVPYLSMPISIGAISLSLANLSAAILAVVSIITILIVYYKTKLGLAMRATVQNREAALMFGVNINNIYAITMAISLALATAAGSLVALTLAFGPVQGSLYTLLSFLIVVLGGMGYPMGSIIAGLVMGLTQSLVATYLGSAYVYAIMFMMLYVILLISPRGILRRGV